MTATVAATGGLEVVQVPIDHLVPSENNPRKTIDAKQLVELGSSIAQIGIQVPLLVRPMCNADDGDLEHYEIIAGHRRYFASIQEKLAELPCIVRELSDEEAREIMIVENLQREDLPPLEEADAYQALLETLGSTLAVAARVGKPIEYVTRRLKLRTLTLLSRRALSERLVAIDHALLLCKLAAKEQEDVLKWCLDVKAGIKTSCEKVLEDVLKRRNERDGKWGYWEARSVLDLKHHIEQVTDLLLAKAAWDLNDAELLPSAGACSDCSKNTAHNTALFGDLLVEKASCTDSKCFDAKRQAFVQARLDDVEAAGKSAVRLSWRDSSAKPSKMDFARQTFKWGQWVEAKKGSCPSVKTGVTIDYPRGYDVEDRIKRKPGMQILVCVADGCKAHPKAWEKAAKRKSGRTHDPKAEEEKRKKAAEAALTENKQRFAVACSAIDGITRISNNALRRILLAAFPTWGAEIKLKEAMLPGIKKILESGAVDSVEFAKAIAVVSLDGLHVGEWQGVEYERKEFLASLKAIGYDGIAAWEKPNKVVPPSEGKEAAENRQSAGRGASNQKRSTLKPAAKGQKSKPARLSPASRKRVADAVRKHVAARAAAAKKGGAK